MTAHLTLVVDNSDGANAAGRASRGAWRPPAGAVAVPGAEEASGVWMHRHWVPRPPLRRRLERPSAAGATARARVRLDDDRGAVTAEYAVVILAAVAFAGLLVVIMRSAEVRQMLVDLVQNALGTAV